MRLSRYAAAVVAAAFLATTCAACTPKPHGTHSLVEVNEAAMQSGIFYDTTIRVGATGFPFEYQYETEVILSAGVDSPEKETAAVDYLLRLAWAETDYDPNPLQKGNGGSLITVHRADGSFVDTRAIQDELMGDNKCRRCEGLTDRMKHLYGRWPGPMPEIPDVLAHLADTHCDTAKPGPHGTYTCGQIAQIGSEVLGRYIGHIAEPLDGKPRSVDGVVLIRDMVSRDPGKTDIVVNTMWVESDHLDYLLRLVWAETSVEPTGRILLVNAGLNRSTDTGRWSHHREDYEPPCSETAVPVGTDGASFEPECLEQLYGPWPGPVPDAPPPPETTTPSVPSPSPSG